MAQKVVVEMVDDLDGTAGEDVATVGFALDGRSYEIDLNSHNAQELRDSLAEFIAASRRPSSGRGGATTRVATTPQRTAARERSQAIRQWAQDSGQLVAGRGRIPTSVVEAYEEAQRTPQEPAPKAKAARKTTEMASAGSVADKVNPPSFSG
jgi:hypothetical protein